MNSLYRSQLYKEFQAKREERRAMKFTKWLGVVSGLYFGGHLVAYFLLK